MKLLTLIGYNLDEFIEELKKDPTMINPTLPEWDSECSDIAGELFEILDTNDDNVLNQKDSNPLLTKRNSKLIANKVKDLGGFKVEFVSISRIINHMTFYKFECDP